MNLVRALIAASAASLALAFPTKAADTPSDAALRFGARPWVEQISLSPDGTHFAMIQADGEGQGATLMIGDLVKGGDLKPVVRANGKPDRLSSCAWTSDSRLICNIYIVRDGPDRLVYTRMVSLNSDGSDVKILTAQQNGQLMGVLQQGGQVIDWSPEGAPGSVLMTRQFVPEFGTGTIISDQRQGLGVELVDATSLKRSVVEQPTKDAREYISDGHGNVRIRGLRPKLGDAYDKNRVIYEYRMLGSRDWKPLGEVHTNGSTFTGFDPYAVDSATNLAYGVEVTGGRAGLYSIALDATLHKTLVLSNPDVDVDGLIWIGRQRRVVGASWVTDRRIQQFFDPELQKLRAGLGKAIPNKPSIYFVDASADETRLLLFASADNEPGTYYLFDKTTRRLAEVVPQRPQLQPLTLATMRAITYPAADGTQIPAYLTLPPGSAGKNLPAIVMPHGGANARDAWGFDWLSQFFAARGYAVIQPNFRGSGGYGEAWFQRNGFQSWKAAVGDINDAGRWLTAQGIAAPGKLAIFGWSYGGYAALQTSVAEPDLFKAIVAVGPITDLDMLREESRPFTRFNLVDQFIGHGEHVRAGSPLRNAAKIKAPVLIFHGDMDVDVGIAESRAMANKLKAFGKPVELVEFKGLDHQLKDGAARAAMLDKADRFLRGSLGLPLAP